MNGSFPRRKPCWINLRISLGIVTALVVSVALVGCHPAPPPKMNKVAKVVVAAPVVSEVTDYQDFTGRMDALKTVDIRPRVSGYITEAPFVEGDVVKEGDLLFQIDPRPYQADLNQAKANLELAKADVVLQTRREQRGRDLIRSAAGAIGPEDYDQLVAAREKAIANVASTKAALERATLNLDWTRVTVPPLRDDKGNRLEGRISRRQVDPGNLVNADQTILTTLVSIDPMYAYFDVDERTYLELAALTVPGSASYFSALQFPVLMRLANEEEFKQKGSVNFLDNRLSANTGTVRMRGVFANSSGVLKSGLFVRIRLPIGVPHKMLLIPAEAVSSDQGRKKIYVLRENEKSTKVGKTVKYVSVKLGQSLDGLSAIVRDKAEDDPNDPDQLKSYDRVIVSGIQQVKPGDVVEVKEERKLEVPVSSLTKVLKEDRPAVDPSKPAAAAPDLKDMPRVGSGKQQHEGKGRR
ncbi:MAG: efflux RND transporter periplasmic adaptor subunit [Gemmataceae bacterium]